MDFRIDFKKNNGLVPCIVQDAGTGCVLMLGYMNEEAYKKTLSENRVTFFSRSKQRLWTKGETSGNFLECVEMLSDCDGDTLLIKAIPAGPVCHTGADTCFKEINQSPFTLDKLDEIIKHRKKHPVDGSYTNKLLDSGINRIAQKVGEEAVEMVIESKDSNRERFLSESADLMYHYLVLLTAKGLSLKDVIEVLKVRHTG